MKLLLIMTGLIALLSACDSSTAPPPREEEVNPDDAREKDSFSKDKSIPHVVP